MTEDSVETKRKKEEKNDLNAAEKKNANTDILVKEALFGCREAAPDAEIRFVNTCNLNIGRCRGCGACSTQLEKGKDNVCIFKDDFQALEEEVRWADAIVLGAPVYRLCRPVQLPT